MTMIPATQSKQTLALSTRKRTRITGFPLLAFVKFPDGTTDQFGASLEGYWQCVGKIWDNGKPTLVLQHSDDYRVIYVSPREVERVRR